MGFKLPDFGDKLKGLGTGLANFASPLSSLFGNETVTPSNERLLMPINPLLTDYNIGKDLFRVRLKSRANRVSKVDGDKIKQDKNDGLLKYNLEILYAAPSLSVSHSFDYSNSFLGEVMEGANSMTRGLNRTGAGFEALSTAGGNVVDAIQGANVGGLDVAPIYKGSTRPSFTFNFILLAHTDPFLEVVLPCQFLQYLAYPQISPSNGDSLIKMLNRHSQSGAFPGSNEDFTRDPTVGDLAEDRPQKKGESKEDYEKFRLEAEKKRDTLLSKFSADGGNNWRYQTGSPPDFWEVETSSGIMNIKFAHISGLNITYHSPWVSPARSYEGKYASSLQFANAVSSIVNSGAQGGESGVASMVKSIFPNSLDFGASALKSIGGALPGSLGAGLKDFSGEVDYGFEGGYPSYAEVSMTLTSNYEKTFGEDWLVDSKPSPIKVSKGMAVNALFGAANSVIKNVF